tara:strand:- start:153 stop:416 length:264 start_codon:yes stop_codon:yes gene_type:complete
VVAVVDIIVVLQLDQEKMVVQVVVEQDNLLEDQVIVPQSIQLKEVVVVMVELALNIVLVVVAELYVEEHPHLTQVLEVQVEQERHQE